MQTAAEWAPEAAAVAQYKLLDKAVDLSAVEDTKVAASLYHGTSSSGPKGAPGRDLWHRPDRASSRSPGAALGRPRGPLSVGVGNMG